MKTDTKLKVYHIIYEPTFKSVIFHHWTECNLKCRGCYCNVEKFDFSLYDDWEKNLSEKTSETPPDRFVSLNEAIERIGGLDIERAIFIGTEPSIDSGLPHLAKILHDRFGSYNILFTNGQTLPDLTRIDEVVMSLKAVTPNIYRAYTEADNKKVLANFRKVFEAGKKLQAEILLIPEVVECEEVENTAEFIASVSKDITLRINGYIAVNSAPYRSASPEEVKRAALLAEKHLSKVNYLTADMPRIGEKTVRVL